MVWLSLHSRKSKWSWLSLVTLFSRPQQGSSQHKRILFSRLTDAFLNGTVKEVTNIVVPAEAVKQMFQQEEWCLENASTLKFLPYDAIKFFQT